MVRKASVRELHLKTSEIVKQVANGDTVVIEKHGLPIAEIRPIAEPGQGPRFPDREAWIQSMPELPDSGRILEEDRM